MALYQQLLVVRSQLGDRSAMEQLVAMWERRLLIGALSLAGFGGAPAAGLAMLAVVPVVLSSVVVVGHAIHQAELRIQQRLLEIEFRLASASAIREADVLGQNQRASSA